MFDNNFFPSEVLVAVLTLTKTKRDNYYEQLFQANSEDPWIMIIKMADRLHNLETIRGFGLAKRICYLEETLSMFLCLCRRSVESIRREYPELVPIYEGMINQIETTGRRKLCCAESQKCRSGD